MAKFTFNLVEHEGDYETGVAVITGPIGPPGGVDTVFGRSGDVTAEPGDYRGNDITNDSSILEGSTITEAMDSFAQTISGIIQTYIPQITNKVDNSDLQLALSTKVDKAQAAPVSPNSPGAAGQLAWDANYIYVCVSANTWKRAPLETWEV